MTSALHMVGGAPAGAMLDPHWDSVVLLVHFQGAHGAKPFVDSSKYGRNMINNGSCYCSTDTAQAPSTIKFGTSNGWFEGDDDYFQPTLTPTPAELIIGTKDFTIEMWVARDRAGSGQMLFEMRDGSDAALAPAMGINANEKFIIIKPGNVQSICPTVLALNTWYHLAWSRVANVSRAFVNGVKEAEVADTTNYSYQPGAGTNRPLMGRSHTDGSDFRGNMTELRYTVGVGRYVENFPVPTAPFPNGHY